MKSSIQSSWMQYWNQVSWFIIEPFLLQARTKLEYNSCQKFWMKKEHCIIAEKKIDMLKYFSFKLHLSISSKHIDFLKIVCAYIWKNTKR